MTNIGITELIMEQFHDDNVVHLHKLYELILTHPKITGDATKLKHNVRSILYQLVKNKKIYKIDSGIYKKSKSN